MTLPKPLLYLLLALPITLFYGATYGTALSRSGIIASVLLLITLAAPLLRRRLPHLLRHRRALGVAAFLYSALHLAIYLFRNSDRALSAALTPELLTGWLAFLVWAALAFTSRDAAVRAMGPRWRKLHRLSWPAAWLLFLHWFLTAFDPWPGAILFGAALAALTLLRARKRYRSP